MKSFCESRYECIKYDQKTSLYVVMRNCTDVVVVVVVVAVNFVSK